MANTHTTLTDLFSDIADAIRAKTGETGVLVADNFPSLIEAISTGLDMTEFSIFSKVAVDEFTPTSNTNAPKINHSLGKVPLAYIILPVEHNAKANALVSMFGITKGSGSDYWVYNMYNATGTSLATGSGSAYATPTTTTIQPKTSLNHFLAGVRHKVITMC